AVPTLGSQALNELSPYLALSEELAKPEAIVADHMEIVDRTYVDDDPVKGWETVTWEFLLKVTNRGDEEIILPAANVTLYYLDGVLGKGFISDKYEIEAGKSKMVNLYLIMENNRLSKTWFTALLLGEPLDLTAVFEPFILTEGENEQPFLPLNMVQELEFSFPRQSRGPAPFIHSITRYHVGSNQPVKISVSASDEGTGISNRTYIYYSIDGGSSWDKSLLIGGEWSNKYNFHYDEYGRPTGLLDGYYPIRSTLQPETYEGEIPGFSPGTSVLFKVYLEDYAGNHEHKKTANWVESQIYSYIVPSAGALPEFTAEFQQITEPSSTDKFFNYLELNGINIQNYLYINGIESNYLLNRMHLISEFFYYNDIDASYCFGMLNIDTEKGYEIMADSGISSGYLLQVFGLSIDDFFDYLVEHVFLPTKHDLAKQAGRILNEMNVIDELELLSIPSWKPENSSDTATAEFLAGPKRKNIGKDRVGDYMLKWWIKTGGPSSIGRDFSSNPIDLKKSDFLTFYLDYPVAQYERINGNISVILIDDKGRTMTSKQITFENDGSQLSQTIPLQQITLELNSKDFTKEPGFALRKIHQINFTYSGIENVQIFLDYISAYSSRAYNVHQYLMYDFGLSGLNMKKFLFGRPETYFEPAAFWSIAANLMMTSFQPDDIITDWSLKQYRKEVYKRTAAWNFLDLVATDNGTLSLENGILGDLGVLNNHMTAANLIIEDRVMIVGQPYPAITFLNRSSINFYETLCLLLDTKIVVFDEEPIDKEDIYPYTQNVGMLMVYVPLGAVGALAIVLRVRQQRYKTKIKKIHTKYKKIGKG
ncbi:MAG: hypothetical protein ACFFCM_15525, partial [Promethearchaeota archaeon]